MLMLTRKAGEAIIIDGTIKVVVDQIRSNRVVIGVDAPHDVTVWRKEIWDDMQEHDGFGEQEQDGKW